jgi:hypothetical protein
VNLFVGCDKRSEFQDGVPARTITEVGGRPRSSQISAPAHREPCSARLSYPTPLPAELSSRNDGKQLSFLVTGGDNIVKEQFTSHFLIG